MRWLQWLDSLINGAWTHASNELFAAFVSAMSGGGHTERWSRARRVLPFLVWLPQVTSRTLRGDLMAALTSTVIVLPQGVAYALIAGLPPEYGLYTAIVTPIVAGLFGSSHHMVSGPVAAVSIVVFSVASGVVAPGSPEYVSVVLTLTFMAGAIQLVLGLIRMGALVNFISHTVVVGFTAGAAVLIAVSQLSHFFGLPIPSGASVVDTLTAFVRTVDESNFYVIAVGLVTLLSSIAIRRLRPRWPGMFFAMILGSLFCLAINGAAHGVPRIGAMTGQFPPLSTPMFSLTTWRELGPGALAIAVIALVEAVSIARSVAARSQQRIHGNQEFIGQGLSNIVGSFFSCYASSGSFTRTGANYDSGAQTPLAAIFSAIIVAAVLLLAPGLTAFLPMPAMAGIVLLVAWNLVDFRELRRIIKASRSEAVVLLVTFLATLLLALEYAIYVGVLLSLALYLQRTAHPRLTVVAPMGDRPGRPMRNVAKRGLLECPQLKILRIDGSLFFGAVNHVQGRLHELTETGYRHILLTGSGVNSIDVSGAEMLAREARRLHSLDGVLYLCYFKGVATDVLRQDVYMDDIGRDNMFSSSNAAVAAIFQRLDFERCKVCRNRIFEECANVPYE